MTDQQCLMKIIKESIITITRSESFTQRSEHTSITFWHRVSWSGHFTVEADVILGSVTHTHNFLIVHGVSCEINEHEWAKIINLTGISEWYLGANFSCILRVLIPVWSNFIGFMILYIRSIMFLMSAADSSSSCAMGSSSMTPFSAATNKYPGT